MDTWQIILSILAGTALVAAYFWVIRDFNKMSDKDKQDFGNPG